MRNVMILVLLVLCPVFAKKKPTPMTTPAVKVDIRERNRSQTPNLNNERWTLTLDVTNISSQPVDFNSKQLILIDSQGQQFSMSLPRYGVPVHVEPNQMQKVQNVSFDIPQNDHPAKLVLRRKNGSLLVDANF